MRVVLEMEPGAAEKFLAYLSSVRTRAANELVAAQREVDIARMTDVVRSLGEVSRGVALALQAHAAEDRQFRDRKKRELQQLRARGVA